MKKFFALLALVAVVLACSVPVEAAEDQGPTVNIDIQNRLQETQVWCWVAVAQQIIAYSAGRSPSQCALVASADLVPPAMCCSGYNPSCVHTGSMEQLRFLLLAYGSNTSQIIMAPRDPRVLYQHLDNDHPIVLQIRSGVASTHVVVLRGMRLTSNDAILYVNDPMSIYTQAVPYSRLYPIIVNALVVN
jgi:hypothetical protein